MWKHLERLGGGIGTRGPGETEIETDRRIVRDKISLLRKRLQEIRGVVPSLREEIAGCIFAPRCPHATDRCVAEYPPLEEKSGGHWVACWHSDAIVAGAGQADVVAAGAT